MPRLPIGSQPMTPAQRMRRYRARRRAARVIIPRDAPDEAVIAALYQWLDGRNVRDREHDNVFGMNWTVKALFAYEAGEPVPPAADWTPWSRRGASST